MGNVHTKNLHSVISPVLFGFKIWWNKSVQKTWCVLFVFESLNHLIAHYATTLLNNWTEEGMSGLKTECCNVLQEKIMLNYVYYV